MANFSHFEKMGHFDRGSDMLTVFASAQIRLRRICGPLAHLSASCVDGAKVGLRIVLDHLWI